MRAADGWQDGERLAWLGLAIVPGLSPRRAFALVRQVGAVEGVARQSQKALTAQGLSDQTAEAVRTATTLATAEVERLGALGGHVVTWADEAYPASLRTIPDPPLALFVRGRLPADDTPAVAIVGSRRASAYGQGVARDLAHGLAAAGVTVVSGLATGIDGAAHQGALDARGVTVAVMGTGLAHVYPAHHRPLSRAIAESGALVTEFPCDLGGRPAHFPRRNRVISGLSRATLVVEAGERSGSLITARCAAEQGRDVLAVPGPIGVPAHVGPHRLIQDGAKLVTCVRDVLEEVAPALVALIDQTSADQAPIVDGLTTAEAGVLSVLHDGPRQLDGVIVATGLAASELLETLLALELRGLVEQQPGLWFRRKAA